MYIQFYSTPADTRSPYWNDQDDCENPASISFVVERDSLPQRFDPVDLNCDGVVGVADLLVLLGEWGTCSDPNDCPADLNSDGDVNVSDLLTLLSNWG